MAPTPRHALTLAVDTALHGCDPTSALRPLLALLRSAPHDFDARLTAGLVFLSLGDIPRASDILSASLRQCALHGYPLKALVALRRLIYLDPAGRQLVRPFASRYASGAPALGRSVRLGAPDPELSVSETLWPEASLDSTQLFALTAHLATTDDDLPAPPVSVSPIPLLSDLPVDALERVLHTITTRSLRPGETLLREGDPGDSFFMLASGTLDVTHANQHLATLTEGAVVGEMALLSSAPRTATVTARAPSHVIIFGRAALTAAAQELPLIAQGLERFMRHRLVDHLLNTHPFFAPFSPAERVQLSAHFEARSFTSGTALITEGTEGQHLWILLTGSVSVTRENVSLATLGPGALLGELSLLDRCLTTATVTAKENGAALTLDRELFLRLVSHVPALKTYLEDLADERRLDLRLSLVPNETPLV